MRAVLLLVAAVPLGLAGGYAWSAWSRPPAHVHVRPAVEPKEIDPPESAADKQWDSRSLEQGAPPVVAAADPTIVEQSVYYPSCHDAWAAGKASIHAGEPGYRPGLDGDNDGVACEPIRSR
ncbi:MAG TPA: excalibur calcium-binding domain-containing protein [Sphingomicrobium sp.]|nr:excalibur calcium-binding domain-containing protein [Sphingomicrobium sp.]